MNDTKMTPKQVIEKWISVFNEANADELSNLYATNAINHQVANEPVIGQKAIKQMFETEFANFEMVCIPENIFEDGDWVILEWKDPKGLRGCGFFNVRDDKIVFQRGYWDKLSLYKLYNIPLPI